LNKNSLFLMKKEITLKNGALMAQEWRFF